MGAWLMSSETAYIHCNHQAFPEGALSMMTGGTGREVWRGRRMDEG